MSSPNPFASPNPVREPCECGSYACRVQSPHFCRTTGTVRVVQPGSGPGTVRLRQMFDTKLAGGETTPAVGDGGAPAPEASPDTGSRRSAPTAGRQSTPARRKK